MAKNVANIPEVINNFNVYKSGTKLIGISGSISLPSFEAVTEEISGAGVLGSYETSIAGYFGSMTQEIPFRFVDEEACDFMSPNAAVDVTFRASAQSTVKATGAIDYKGLRVVEKGRTKSFNLGKLENGKQMESSVTIELMYILIEYNGKKLIELDKLNEVFIVNGTDLLEKVRANT